MTTYRALKETIIILFCLVGIMCLMTLLNQALDYNFMQWSLKPHLEKGIIGIATGPFLHANFNHLLVNAIALVCLGTLLGLSGKRVFYWTTLLGILATGWIIWLWGRDASYLGAGSLVFAYFGCLLVRAPAKRHMFVFCLALAIWVVYLLILLGYTQIKILPQWDYLLASLGVGVLTGLTFVRH